MNRSRLWLKILIVCVLLAVMTGSIFLLAPGFDAGHHFISQKFLLRTNARMEAYCGRSLPGFDLHKLKPVRVQVEPGINMLLDPADLVPRAILTSGQWQGGVWNSIDKGLSAGSVFMDVGAHIGYFTLKGSLKVGPGGRVIAFEPNRKTLEILRGNIASSNAGNVLVEPIACSDKEETMTFTDTTGEGNSGRSMVSLGAPAETNRQVISYNVIGRPIDDVAREIGLARLDAVKVDVEGAETMVLRGARETLKRFHPKVIAEVKREHLGRMGSSPEELTALMQELGYTKHRLIDSEDWEWMVP